MLCRRGPAMDAGGGRDCWGNKDIRRVNLENCLDTKMDLGSVMAALGESFGEFNVLSAINLTLCSSFPLDSGGA